MLKLKKLSKVFRYLKVKEVRLLSKSLIEEFKNQCSANQIITMSENTLTEVHALPIHGGFTGRHLVCHFDEHSHHTNRDEVLSKLKDVTDKVPIFYDNLVTEEQNDEHESRMCCEPLNQVRHNGKTLEFPNLWDDLYLVKRDSSSKTSRWIVTDRTQSEVSEFLSDFGYYNDIEGLYSSQLALVTLNTGFAKYLCLKLPDLAVKLGIGERDE